MSEISTYERAKLRLQAFGLLDGWGRPNEKGVFVPDDIQRRKENAVDLVDWAIADHAEPSIGETP